MDWKKKLTNELEEMIEKDMENAAQAAPPPEMSGPVLYYTEAVIDHFENPRNIGEMDEEEADGFALSGDPLCGDQMKLWIRVEENRVADIKFKSFGCPGAIATSSMVTHLARGMGLEEAMALTDDDVVEALGGIPENKKHCSLLGINALHAAIADYLQRSKNNCIQKQTEKS